MIVPEGVIPTLMKFESVVRNGLPSCTLSRAQVCGLMNMLEGYGSDVYRLPPQAWWQLKDEEYYSSTLP